MKITEKLSHSSASELRGCEYRWWLRKVKKTRADLDYRESDGLSVGKAVHHIQERSRHEPAALAPLLKECAVSSDIRLSKYNFGLVAVMCQVYWAYQAQCGLEVIGVEYEIDNERVSGFLDLISLDPDTGLWFIEDLKCFKSFSPNTVVGLPKDPQLNLYAGFKNEVAKEYGLDPEKFGGAGYRVVTKTTSKVRESETITQFIARTRKLIKVYRVIVPASELAVEATGKNHSVVQLRAERILEGDTPSKNYGYCMNYFSPCQFWSKCHGKTYTDSLEDAKLRIDLFEGR